MPGGLEFDFSCRQCLDLNDFKIEIMECFQSKALRLITDAPWYVPNSVIRNDLQIPTIKEEITGLSSQVQRWAKHASQPSSNSTL
jgi:hypothetical protein